MRNPISLTAFADANTNFGFRLLRRLAEDHSVGNVFFSPLSLSSALAMTLNGAGGQTERDMAKTLGLETLTRDEINSLYGALLTALTASGPGVSVKVANALWAGRGTGFKADFQERCRLFYNASTESLDFSLPESAAIINDWTSWNTDGKINQLVTHADIAGALGVLTNAVYFHGLWQKPFEKEDTQDAPFFAPGGPKPVPMMRQTGSFSYTETASCQAISLPYGEGRMRLIIVLPKPELTVEALVNSLNAKLWAALTAAMQPARLALFLPRFKAEFTVRLRGPLSALGMESAFERTADFGGIGYGGWFIGDVIHKAVLEVEEQGTVAAAATAVVMMRTAMPRLTPVLRVDRPFFLSIRDTQTGTILFAGIIHDPQ